MTTRGAAIRLASLTVAAALAAACDRPRPKETVEPWVAPPTLARLEGFVQTCSGGGTPRPYNGVTPGWWIASVAGSGGVVECDARWSAELGCLESVSLVFYTDERQGLPEDTDVQRVVAPITTLLPPGAQQTAIRVASRHFRGDAPDVVDGSFAFHGGRMPSMITLTVALKDDEELQIRRRLRRPW